MTIINEPSVLTTSNAVRTLGMVAGEGFEPSTFGL